MATLGSRGHSLGVPDPGSERIGAVRPEDRPTDKSIAELRSGLRGRRFVGLKEAVEIHSNAFGMSRTRSLTPLLFADRVVTAGRATATISFVPKQLVGIAWLAIGVLFMAVPGVMATEVSNSSTTVRTIVALGTGAASIVGLFESLRRWVLARRWRRHTGPTAEIADLCAWPSGAGHAGRLLDAVCSGADHTGVGLVLRVNETNGRAIELYRGAGFVFVPNSSRDRLVRMMRPTADRFRPSTDHRSVLAGVCVAAIAVTVALSWIADRDIVAASCLLGGLAALTAACSVDVQELRLPNAWTGLALAFGVAGALAASVGPSVLFGMAVGAAPFLLLHLLDPGALGFGDVKFAGAAGAVVAIVWWPASAVMAIAGLVASLVHRAISPPGPRPFGPTLMLGTLVAVLSAPFLVSKGLIT